MAFLFQDQNQGIRNDVSPHANARRPPQTVLFHPDCNRRLRNHTESADPSSRERRRRSRAWATSPLPPVGIFTPPWEHRPPGMDDLPWEYDQRRGVSKHLWHGESACPHAAGTGRARL